MSSQETPSAPSARTAATVPTLSASAQAITVERLTKTYGGRDAVHAVSFAVQPGQVFALLGPNGAGKTTTVEMLEGYRAADAGAIRVLGLDPRRQGAELRPRIGVMLQQDGLYPGLRAHEVLDLFASFFAAPAAPDALLDLVGLRDAARTRCRQLSGGQKRRLALAVALVGQPEVLFLDEPTTGMDPQARRATWDIIRTVQQRGTTVLLTTHFMDEAERLADQIAILDNGHLIALDTPAALTQGATANAVRFMAAPGLDLAALGALPAATVVHEDAPGSYVIETANPPALLVELTTWLRAQSAGLRELRVGYGSLEDVFLRLTGKEMRD